MIKIIIKLVGEASTRDPGFIQVFNILQRRALEALGMTQLGRNYYDPKGQISLKDFKLNLWPGYVTSIRQHEHKLLLCSEVSNKILRMDTVLDQLEQIKRAVGSGDVVNACKKSLVGSICMTRYNNKTYRIEEIYFNKKPSETFNVSYLLC